MRRLAPPPGRPCERASARSARPRSNSGITACTVSTLPMSPATMRRFRAGDDFRIGNPRRSGGALRERRAASPSCRSARSSPRDRLGAFDEDVIAGRDGRRRAARRCDERAGSIGLHEEPGEHGLGACPIGAATTRSPVEVQDLRSARSRSKPAASPAVLRFARISASSCSRSRATRRLALANLRGDELRECDTQVRAYPAHLFVRATRAGVDQRGRATDLKSALSVDGQQLFRPT